MNNNWIWRIREVEHGFMLEKGMFHEGGILGPTSIGFTMPGFIQYEFSCYNTESEAMKELKRKNPSNKLKTFMLVDVKLPQISGKCFKFTECESV